MRNPSAVLLLTAIAANASTTAAWEMNTFQDFLQGRFTGVSLGREGRLALAPRMEQLFSSDQPFLWSVAEGAGGMFYVGTGHKGRVYRVDANGKSVLLWTAPEPEIFALAAAPDGSVFAGTSPDGKIYRIQNGKAEEYFSPKSRYIWALAIGKDGALYAGTGDAGKVFRITGSGAGEVYYDTGQANVTCLASDANGQLLAGTEPNGLLYRISARDKAFVLYDANLPEIRTIALGPDGVVYAAALGGSVAQRTTAASSNAQTSSSGPVTAPTTSITVTDQAQAGLEIKPKPTAEAPKTATPAAPAYTPAVEMAGVEKSAIYKILPDNSVETLWSSKDENVYDVLVAGQDLVFATDLHGRIYRMFADRHVTLLTQAAEGETVRLVQSGASLIAATGTQGKLYRLTGGGKLEGTYESPIHDAGSVAKWGQVTWRGERREGAALAFRFRSGNSARPDRTWSDWSVPVLNPNGSGIHSPNARFVQWRADFSGSESLTPTVTGVTVSYLPQNNPPLIKSLNVTAQVAALTVSGKAAAQSQPATGTYSITVTDTGESGASTLSGTPTQTVSRGMSQQIQITWAAEDVDGDRLTYSLWFKGEDESAWKLVRSNMSENAITLEGDVFADGKYLFRVIASDSPSNPGVAARQAELISAPVQFDNTPPVLRSTGQRHSGADWQIDVTAFDEASGLRRAEYSVDAGPWLPLEAADGVVDGKEEKFTIRLERATPGEHLVVIRAYDSSNNAGLTKVIIR